MKTLNQIITGNATTETEKAIQAAFWAGQEQAKGKIHRAIKQNFLNHNFGRYHGIEAGMINTILNQTGVEISFDKSIPTDMADEILAWDFSI